MELDWVVQEVFACACSLVACCRLHWNNIWSKLRIYIPKVVSMKASGNSSKPLVAGSNPASSIWRSCNSVVRVRVLWRFILIYMGMYSLFPKGGVVFMVSFSGVQNRFCSKLVLFPCMVRKRWIIAIRCDELFVINFFFMLLYWVQPGVPGTVWYRGYEPFVFTIFSLYFLFPSLPFRIYFHNLVRIDLKLSFLFTFGTTATILQSYIARSL